MPPRLTKPTDVPTPRRALVDELWRFYVAAHRPPTRRIAEAIEKLPDEQRNGTANHETIRRTLRGEAVGSWQTVEVIFLALCEIADVDPEDDDYDPDDNWNGRRSTHIEDVRNAWHQAVDGAQIGSIPRTRTQREAEAAERRAQDEALNRSRASFASDDPWATPAKGSSFDDEPPF